jgi:uncharacterized protein
VLVCDTSALFAYFDVSEPDHAEVSAAIEADPGPFLVSPYVLGELDYLMAKRHGPQAELAALLELSGGAWEHPSIDASDLQRAHALITRYRGQDIGLADASLVLLAARYRTDRLLTLDHRHFRVVRATNGDPFVLLPSVH